MLETQRTEFYSLVVDGYNAHIHLKISKNSETSLLTANSIERSTTRGLNIQDASAHVQVWYYAVCVWVAVCVKYKKPDKKTEINERRSESSVDSLAVKQSNLKGIAAAHIKAFVFRSAAFKEPPFRGE